MQDEAETIYELWDGELPISPKHSLLYHLDPIGVGTPLVESLTSYLIRLADAHSVYPRKLFTSMLFPPLKLPYLYSDGRPVYDHLTTFWIQSSGLNGMGTLASSLVQVLEQLTLRSNLRFLTMLPWKEVLATRKLLRRTRAWCSACYEEWRENQQLMYEPLLWMLEVIRICPKHKQMLQMRCPNPNCARMLSPLAPRAQPGFCAWCNRWLGYPAQCEHPHTLDSEEMEQQQWIANSVGEILATSPTMALPLSREGFVTTLNQCVTEAGNLFAATRLLRVHQKSLYLMISGQQIPTLGILVRMCVRLKIPLLCFLTGNLSHISASQAKVAPNDTVSVKAKRKLRKFDAQKLQSALQAVLQASEEPPPSMREVGRRLGYDATHLAQHFPELCRMISERYIAYLSEQKQQRLYKLGEEVRQAALTLHAQGKYPSSIKISKILGTYGVFKEKRAYEIWQNTLQELGLKP